MTLQGKKDAILRYVDYSGRNGCTRETLFEMLTGLFPDLEQDGSFAEEMDNILAELVHDRIFKADIVTILPHQRANPTKNEIRTNSYTLTQEGKQVADNVTNSDVLTAILTEEKKANYLLSGSLKYINTLSTKTARQEISESIYEFVGTLSKHERYRIYSQAAEWIIEDFFKEHGFVKVVGETKHGSEVLGFSDRGKKLVEIGDLDKFYTWEREERRKEIERQELNDQLLKINVSSGRIQQSLLSINFWIAVGTIAAAAYSAVQLVDYFSSLIQKHYRLYYGAAVTVYLLLLGCLFGVSLVLVTQRLSKAIRRRGARS